MAKAVPKRFIIVLMKSIFCGVFAYSQNINSISETKSRAEVAACPICVEGDPIVEKELLRLSLLKPQELITEVRKQGICVQVLKSNRKSPEQFFTWSKIEKSEKPLSDITKQKNLMGKTFCKDEHLISKGCTTIVLASDAPKSTLLHEYLHVKQIEKDAKWCPLSKELWSREPSPAESKLIRDKEWDVHRVLWAHLEQLNVDIEDKLAVISETLQEAWLRKDFDSEALKFVKSEKMSKRLGSLFATYKSQLKPVQKKIKFIDGIAVTDQGKKKYWKKLPVSVCLDSKIPPEYKAVILKAADVWNKSFVRPIFDLSCTSDFTDAQIGQSVDHSIHWVTKDFVNFGDKTTLARTLSAADDDTGEFQGVSILVNAETYKWRVASAVPSVKNGSVTEKPVCELDQQKLEAVLVHELGHVFGLAHNNISLNSVMGANLPYQSGIYFEHLGDYELSAIRHNYFLDNQNIPSYLTAALNEDLNGAIKILKSKPSKNIEEKYALAILEKSAKHTGVAIKNFKELISNDSKNIKALYELGDTYWALQKNQEARKYFKEVLEINPNYYEALANLGVISFNENHKLEAKLYFEKALKVNPVHFVACFYLYQISHEPR
ncbi:MAG: tetratricopeptide repeat protein, partial [Bdellovibrionales bacterium]